MKADYFNVRLWCLLAWLFCDNLFMLVIYPRVYHPRLPAGRSSSRPCAERIAGLRFLTTRFARREIGNIPTCPALNCSLWFPGDLTQCVPPLPIPNREVKALGPDDSQQWRK